MAVSTLGKRTRKSIEREDAEVLLPPRKRQTRSSAIQIFEDAEEHAARAPCSSTLCVGSKVRNGRTSLKSRCVRAKSEKPLQVSHSELQDENRPPEDVEVQTPTANRIGDFLKTNSSTPKHQVRFTGGLLTPRTPRIVGVNKPRTQSAFATARLLFNQSATPTRLVGRDSEREQLREFIAKAADTKHGGCLYVSGPPGTGKSALVHEVFQEFEPNPAVRMSVINCVSLRTSADIYAKLLEDLAPNVKVEKSAAKTQLQKMFNNKRKSTLYAVLLDEIDSLVDGDCETLYELFEWSMNATTSLALVGIANALDLTDRVLPKLRTRDVKPQLLPFLPYTGQQISNIITDKLRSLLPEDTADKAFVPFAHPTAILLCGKKIASQTGDLRKAFGLMRRGIDQVEKETNAKLSTNLSQPFGEMANSTFAAGQIPAEYTPVTAPRVTIAHIARLASSIFNNGTVSRLGCLNLQQKAVLCSLVASERRKQERNPYITPSKSSKKIPTVRELFCKYAALCGRDDGILQPLKGTEFRDVVSSLETLGLVHESHRSSCVVTPTSSSSRSDRSSDDRQIVSGVSEREMRDSLSGAGGDLLRRLLDE